MMEGFNQESAAQTEQKEWLGKSNLTKEQASSDQIIEDPVSRYFELMRKVSAQTHDFIKRRIRSFEHMSDFPRNAELLDEMLRLPDARKDKNILRSVLTELIYRNLGGEDTDITPALALSELNNYNGYLDNWILDDKKQVWMTTNARERISQITLVSGLFRELIDEVIMELDTSDANKLQIIKIFSQAMARSYQGQELDLQMTIETVGDYKNDVAYIRAYIRKSLLQSGYLYGASTEMGAVLAGTDSEEIELARKIGEVIGTGLHMSNDLGDFAIIEGQGGDFKNYQDQMADLKNGRLTLPVYYILKHGTAQEKEVVLKVANNKTASPKDEMAVAKAIHTSGSFEYCKRLVRRYHNKAKSLISKLPENKEREMLSMSSIVIRSNKYLSNLSKFASHSDNT